MRKVAILLVIFILFSSMAWVKLTLIQPAYITLPEYIKSVAVVNRLANESNQKSNFAEILEEVLTGEVFQQDILASQELIRGMKDMVIGVKRVEIKQVQKSLSGGSKTAVFPKTVPWEIIEQLCRENSTDAVAVIEILDSDYVITNGKKQVEEKDKEGNVRKVTKYTAKGVGAINIGIRLYDPTAKSIIDVYSYEYNDTWSAEGKSVQDAVSQVLQKTDAINKMCYKVGTYYGQRISPIYYTVKREFYNKPKKNKKLAEGVRRSEVADWEGAIEAWMPLIKKYDKKATPHAALNIAVAYEVLGDLDKALEWAQKAYVEYEEKRADDYYKELQRRIREEKIVEQQLRVN